jgi:autotransporter-associated beta strand protein
VPLTVAGPGALAVPDTAGLGISALDLTAGGMLAVSNSATLSLPVTLGAGGGGVAPGQDQTVVVDAAVTGQGPFIKDGASFLMLTNANALYAGPTQVKGGTLRLDKLPVGGGLILGPGTLHYIGGAAAAGGYTLDTGDGTRAAVLRTEGDITFTGKAEALSGALVKTGAGTATFMAAGLNVFSAGPGAGISHHVLDIGPNGESPTTGFGGFNVADGKVVIGGQGQTNLFNGLVVVGLNSTAEADAETAGTLEVVGGSTEIASELIIGRSNGTTNTAPTPRASTLRMSGGEMTVGALVLGRAFEPEGHQSAPRVELSGGLLTVRGPCLWPEQAGANATVTISGGKLDHLAQDNASVRCANYGGDVTLTLSGSGELISARKLLLCFGANSTTTVNLDGGVLKVQNIEKGGSGLSGVVHFNGGTYCPTQVGVLQALTAATVKAGGAVFDLSEIDTYTVAQVLTHDESLLGADGA